MNVLIVTVSGSLVLAALFIVLFLVNSRQSSVEQDSLLPLEDDCGTDTTKPCEDPAN